MKLYSLTRRLITLVLVIELASAIFVSGVAWVYEWHMHFRSFDVLLRGRADSLMGAVQDSEDTKDNVMLDGSELNLPRDDIYDVLDAGARTVGRSANWPQSNEILMAIRSKMNNASSSMDQHGQYINISIDHKNFRVIRIDGLRVVDPGDKDGGVRRYITVYYGSSIERVWRAVRRSVEFYAGASLLVLAITGILMSWLLNRDLAPLRQLASAAANVSVTSWSFIPPEQARMTKELEPLVSALESVLAGLQQSFERQRRFVGDATHELKTGVAVVKSSIQLLSMKPRSQAEYQLGLERCLGDCRRMESLVAQMLTLARIEEQLMTSPSESVSEIYTIIQEVTSQLESMAEVKRIAVLLQTSEPMQPNRLEVAIEHEQAKLLFSNLLMNALQHSPPESVIRTEIRELEGCAEIRITDQGDGIALGDLPLIFERFSRSDPSRSRSTGGTGLGLAVCKAIADRYSGSIQIQSNLNLGTIVIVRLPIAVNQGTFTSS